MDEESITLYFFSSLVNGIPIGYTFFSLFDSGPNESSEEGMKRKTIIALNLIR